MSDFNLLISQTKQKIDSDWIRFHIDKTDDLTLLTSKVLYLQLSPNLYIDYSFRHYSEEISSNDKFYDAKLGFNFIQISPLEYRLVVDLNKNILPSIDLTNIIDFQSYIKVSLYNLELYNKKTQLYEQVKYLDIILPTPISSKTFYLVSDTSLNNYDLNLSYEINLVNSIVNLTFINLPVSNSSTIILELYQDSELISQSSSNYFSNIIPALNFSLDSKQESCLDDVAYSLSALYARHEYTSINRVINGLQNKILLNDNILSEKFNRDQEFSLTKVRSIKSYCLLLYILGINLQTPSTTYSLYQLVKYLKNEINSSISIVTKNLVYGYDEQSNPYQFEDFSLLFLGYLALSISQEFQYDEETEFTLSILDERITLLYTYNFSDINKFDNQTIVEGVFWASLLAYYQSNESQLLKLVILYKFYRESFTLTKTVDIIFNNLVIDIFREVNITIPPVINTELINYTEIGNYLYKPIDNVNVSLLKFSSLIYLFNNKWHKNFNYTYKSYVKNAVMYKKLIEEYCTKYLPFSFSWFNDTAITPQIGVLGALIKSFGYGALLASIKYYSNFNRVDIDKAQGVYLNSWGELLDIPRKINETDTIYRNRLKSFLLFKGNNLKDITNSLKQIDPNILVQSVNSVIQITPETHIEDIVWLVSQLNFLGAKLRVNLRSTFKIEYKKERGLYAGSNNYS